MSFSGNAGMAAAAHAAYGESMGWQWVRGDQATVFEFNRIPQFSELSPREHVAMESACKAALQHFLDNELKEALACDDRVMEVAAMLQVGKSCGHTPLDILRRAIGGFFVMLIDPKKLDAFNFNFDNFNPDPS